VHEAITEVLSSFFDSKLPIQFESVTVVVGFHLDGFETATIGRDCILENELYDELAKLPPAIRAVFEPRNALIHRESVAFTIFVVHAPGRRRSLWRVSHLPVRPGIRVG